MERIVGVFRKWATARNAVLALAAFAVSALVVQILDRPLLDLTRGQDKLDLRFGYDLATVRMLFDAYGEQGRALYGWNLAADVFLPVFAALAGGLWVTLAVRSPIWRKILVVPPLLFGLTDLIENALLFALVRAYPDLPPFLVAVTSLLTQIKRSAYYLTAVEVIFCILYLTVRWFRRRKRAAAV